MESLGEMIKLPKRVALVIAAVTGMDEVLERIEEEKGEEADMCESLNIYVRKNREEAFQNGYHDGEVKGINDGKLQTITNQLKKKLGKLTEETIEKIQQSTTEQLDTLTMSIFDIENEQDIISILL